MASLHLEEKHGGGTQNTPHIALPDGYGNSRETLINSTAPSPLEGEGWGEGYKINRLPLTLTLSLKGRGD
jgi:hypothetical protein